MDQTQTLNLPDESQIKVRQGGNLGEAVQVDLIPLGGVFAQLHENAQFWEGVSDMLIHLDDFGPKQVRAAFEAAVAEQLGRPATSVQLDYQGLMVLQNVLQRAREELSRTLQAAGK